jgi:hypothetical protein
MKRLTFVVLAMLALGAMAPQAQSPVPNMSPLIGIWKTDVDKSTYFPGPRPVPGAGVQVRQYADRGMGLIAEVRWVVSPTGTITAGATNVWSGKFDGKETPAYGLGALETFLEAGTKPMTMRSYKVLDNSSVETTNKTGMVLNNTATIAVSRDGKTMTETIKAFDAHGQQVGVNVIMYDRQ